VVLGVVGISIALQSYFSIRARGSIDRQAVGDDIAFSMLVIAAGVSLISDLKWARAGSLAVWGALLAEVSCEAYWLGSWMIRFWRDGFLYREALPRLAYEVLCLLVGPFVVWKLFVLPSPELRRRVLVATFVGGLALSGIGNLYLLSLRLS
jgi:hypothetical protein